MVKLYDGKAYQFKAVQINSTLLIYSEMKGNSLNSTSQNFCQYFREYARTDQT